MHSDDKFACSRRALLLGATGTAAAFSVRRGRADTSPDIRIAAEPATATLAGPDHPPTPVWAYAGKVPGPTLRLRQGEPARIAVENRLEQNTTVHWHGIRLPIAMDGVPGISQPPIAPGRTFTYAFTPPDAGTFWYHPHSNSLEQLGRGLSGALIVEEAKPVAFDRDLVWVLSDWRLKTDGTIAPGFGNPMDAAMSGRIGKLVTLNGTAPTDQPVRAGERVRLRLINASLARIMALRIEGHRPVVVASDGQPCVPHVPDGGRLLLGPAMRLDIALDLIGDPGARYAVIDDFYDGLSYVLTNLAYSNQPRRSGLIDAPLPKLLRNPLPEPDLASAVRHELKLQGGMMSGMGGGMSGMSHGAWAINGTSMTGDGRLDMAPLLTLQRGQSYILRLANETAWWHPIHLHGHSFRTLRRNHQPVPYEQWGDTVLLAPKDVVDCAFVADNPGDWMLHCHVMDHQVSGLMTVLRVS
jgi:FtsP/CotA-like multicopper oxidase with cupredoxin domain